MQKSDFKNAQRIVDAVSGTASIKRTTEKLCFSRTPRPTFNEFGHCAKPKDPSREYWENVLELTSILDEKGRYAGFSDPHHILRSLAEDGLIWFEMKHVKKAIARRVAK